MNHVGGFSLPTPSRASALVPLLATLDLLHYQVTVKLIEGYCSKLLRTEYI